MLLPRSVRWSARCAWWLFRPDGCLPRRAAAAVKTGRRPPPKAARSGLDGGEHGAMLTKVGRTSTPPPSTQLLGPLSVRSVEIASPRRARLAMTADRNPALTVEPNVFEAPA